MRNETAQLERLTRHCVERAALRPGERVLDLATGTGVGAFAAADVVGRSGGVTGIDISERMVALAEARARATGVRNVDFRRANMEATGAADGGYHAVVCAFGLMFAADHRAAFAELARVTAPGGRVSVCVWGQVEGLGAPGALVRALGRAGLNDVVEERLEVTLEVPAEVVFAIARKR